MSQTFAQLPKLSFARRMLLTWFGCGRSPFAPGTAGSLGALPLGWLISNFAGPLWLLVAATVLCAVGWWCANAELPGEDSDPGWIVADEVVGMWIAMAAAPLTLVWVASAFVLFRFFDITKPWPVSWADRSIGGGLGVMLDDVIAGLYAAGILFIARLALT